MKTLSADSSSELARGLHEPDHRATTVRGQETGLVMLRRRIGGAGVLSFGEATVTGRIKS